MCAVTYYSLFLPTIIRPIDVYMLLSYSDKLFNEFDRIHFKRKQYLVWRYY